MKKKTKHLYLEIYIGPLGLQNVCFRLLDKKPDPRHAARGEGNCLVFKLVDGDYSTEFYEALQNGDVMKDVGNKFIYANLEKLREAKL